MSAYPKPGKQLTFESKLENWAEGMDYCAIPVPASVTKALGTKSAVLVMARVNTSKPFKVSLFPAGGGQHYIRLRAKVRKEAKLKEGDRVKVRITVLDRADITIPKDLASALRAERVAADFDALTAGKKNYIIRRIDDASKSETRKKRIQEAVEEAHRGREKRADRKAT
jgi:translation initiation factor IF-1